MDATGASATTASRWPAWYRTTAQYQQPDLRKAIWQLVNTFLPYTALWVLLVWLLQNQVPYLLVFPLVVLASGFLVRIFIFFHDCGHGSFFASQRANKVLGYLCGFLTLTPYEQWRHSHALHHASVGDLDRRGDGDVWTMTVEEYRNASPLKRFIYRFFRHPLVTFGIGPILIFVVSERFPDKNARQKDKLSVHITNGAIAAALLAAYLTIGLRTLLVIFLPMMAIAASAGVWLFYVQHQFEDTYWAHGKAWEMSRAALEGSSYYQLPKVLQWFSGNIGFHHVHHVRARIPNYHLQRCHEQTPELRSRTPLTIRESLKCMSLDLWDEEQKRLVSFRSLRDRPAG
jgi:omega-6 fatty acid desaturase (delta-12 desaturase)